MGLLGSSPSLLSVRCLLPMAKADCRKSSCLYVEERERDDESLMIPIPGHIQALQQMPQEMLGWHYEFECGFGIPVLKKPLAQSPQTPETPKRHKRYRHHDFEFSLRLAQRGIGALMSCSYRTLFRSFFSQDQSRCPSRDRDLAII